MSSFTSFHQRSLLRGASPELLGNPKFDFTVRTAKCAANNMVTAAAAASYSPHAYNDSATEKKNPQAVMDRNKRRNGQQQPAGNGVGATWVEWESLAVDCNSGSVRCRGGCRQVREKCGRSPPPMTSAGPIVE
jgi:hypothetical protein